MTNSTRIAKTTNLVSNLAKFMILKVRKFRFLGWGYLILFIWLIFSARQQPNLPISQIPNPPNNPNSYPQTSIAIEGAQSKAYKTGDKVTIRWDKPVFDTSFRADHRRLKTKDISCQLDFCTLILSEKVNTLKASWTENGEQFSKEFRLNQ